MLLAKCDRIKKQMQGKVSGPGACAEEGWRPWVRVPGCHQGPAWSCACTHGGKPQSRNRGGGKLNDFPVFISLTYVSGIQI